MAKVLSVLSEGEVSVENRCNWILLWPGESRFTLALIVSGDRLFRDLYPLKLLSSQERSTVALGV